MTWIDIRAGQGSRTAIVRCAIDLLHSKGIVIEAASSWMGPGRRALLLRGATAADAIAILRPDFGPHVTITNLEGDPPDAEDPIETDLFDDAFPTSAIEHTADEAFSVIAPDRADLLAAAAEALGALIVSPRGVQPAVMRSVEVAAPEPDWPDDERLHAWLAEVLYALDAHRFALRRAVIFSDSDGVRGALFGEPLDEGRHEIHGAIKAVTYHGLEIEPVPGGLRAMVIVDV